MKSQLKIFCVICLLLITQIGFSKQKNNIKYTSIKESDTVKNKSVQFNERIFKSIDQKELLKRLFDNPVIDSIGMAVWNPNYYERMSYNLSYDSKCHTAIDTIMYFIDSRKRKCAAVIFGTYHYDYDYFDSTKIECGDSHFAGVPIGIALLSETESKEWELYEFKKAFTTLGYFGEYKRETKDAGKIGLKEIGDKWTCLSLKQGIGGNMGEFSGYESLYSIEEFDIGGFPNSVLTEIFNYTYYYKELRMDEKVKVLEKREIKFIKKKKHYYDLLLTTTKNGKISTELYKYKDEYSEFVKK